LRYKPGCNPNSHKRTLEMNQKTRCSLKEYCKLHPRTDLQIKAAIQNLKAYNLTEKAKEVRSSNGKKFGAKYLILRARSPEGREFCRKLGKRTGKLNSKLYKHRYITKAQRKLSNALLDVGIKHELEWWIFKIRRLIDIAVPSVKLAIEVDGETHTDDRLLKSLGTNLEQKLLDDKLKEEQLKSLGWKVLRFTNNDIEKDLNKIVKEVKNGVF